MINVILFHDVFDTNIVTLLFLDTFRIPGQVLITEKQVLKSQEKLMEHVRPLLGKNVGQAIGDGFRVASMRNSGRRIPCNILHYI